MRDRVQFWPFTSALPGPSENGLVGVGLPTNTNLVALMGKHSRMLLPSGRFARDKTSVPLNIRGRRDSRPDLPDGEFEAVGVVLPTRTSPPMTKPLSDPNGARAGGFLSRFSRHA